MNLLLFFGLVLKASLFSTSGMGNVPALHNDLLARNWSTEKQFGEALAVGQLSPGPNGLWVVSLGYLLGGLRGSLLALLAIICPTVLVLLMNKLYARVKHHAAVDGFIRGMGLAVVGVFVVVLLQLLYRVGLDVRSASITLCSIGLGLYRRISVIVILFLAGIAGILFR